MELYLMQHGQALAESEDAERPLSAVGIARIKQSAAALKRLGLSFDLIICSPKRRGRQTAALVAEAVRYPISDVLAAAVNPTAPASATVDLLELQRDQERVLLVGHLPHLAELATILLSGGAPLNIRFEHGGLLGLKLAADAAAPAELVCCLTPAQLALLAPV